MRVPSGVRNLDRIPHALRKGQKVKGEFYLYILLKNKMLKKINSTTNFKSFKPHAQVRWAGGGAPVALLQMRTLEYRKRTRKFF